MHTGTPSYLSPLTSYIEHCPLALALFPSRYLLPDKPWLRPATFSAMHLYARIARRSASPAEVESSSREPEPTPVPAAAESNDEAVFTDPFAVFTPSAR